MKRVLAVLVALAMVAAVMTPAAWARDGAELVGLYTVPGTSFTVRCIRFEHDDAWRHNQTVMVTTTTDVDSKGRVINTLSGHNSASSIGIGNNFLQGGFAGLAQGAGIVGAGALLRPSNTNVSNNNQGNGASLSQGQNASAYQTQRQRQGQGQLQGQGQAQGNVNTFTPVNANTNVNTNTVIPTNINTLSQGQGQSTGPFSPVTVLP